MQLINSLESANINVIRVPMFDALRASEHRHTDLTDLDGFHGLIRTLMTQIRRIYTDLDRRPVETRFIASLMPLRCDKSEKQ